MAVKLDIAKAYDRIEWSFLQDVMVAANFPMNFIDLIKSVAQAIPTYVMSCFKIPVGVCEEMESKIKQFWWGQKENERRIHWVSWEKLCKPKTEGGMGFRNLEAFNSAFLAKTWWRIKSNPGSLIFKILKARYFHRTSMEDATLGYRPSYTWRSIWGAREIALRGSRWRVGDGKLIKIWKDRWIPSQNGGRILTPINGLDENALVSCLINAQDKYWNNNMIASIFNPHEAQQIRNIPLSWNDHEDKLYWQHTKDGELTVKSAYKDIMLQKEANIAGPSAMIEQFNWRKLWKLQLPAKIKNFIWRLFHDALPIRRNPGHRGIHCPTECPICDEVPEDREHLFMKCAATQAVWFASWLSLRIDMNEQLIPWIKNLLEHNQKEVACTTAITLWSIWKGRNDKVFNGKEFQPIHLVHVGTSMLADFIEMDERNYIQEERTNAAQKWKSPPQPWMILHTDAACFQKAHTGVGSILRDDQGVVISTDCCLLDTSHETLLAEAIALRWGINIALSKGANKLVVCTDSATLAQCFLGAQVPITIQLIVQDCSNLLERLEDFTVTHVRRQHNTPAHLLAKYALECNNGHWIKNIPNHIFHAVMTDVMNQ